MEAHMPDASEILFTRNEDVVDLIEPEIMAKP
jgi:hypothetical protein